MFPVNPDLSTKSASPAPPHAHASHYLFSLDVPHPHPPFFFPLVGLGFELRASYFAKQTIYHLSHTFSPFFSGYF
jgi:hypothetical protein